MIHLLFDLASYLLGFLITFYLKKNVPLFTPQVTQGKDPYYILSATVGLVIGSFLFGTLNSWLSADIHIAKSVVGALVGAIVAIEIYKRFTNIQQSTGSVYVLGLSLSIALGRLGCFFAGLDDFTYGIETHSMFAIDFGDGVNRHPVQLYESFSLVLFALIFMGLLKFNKPFVLSYGFYLFCFVYGAQRFFWEFLKPYHLIVGPFNTFHFLTLFLMLYAVTMIVKQRLRNLHE
ncbi:prolipoprotein diacylglyceryl transferase family protein [Marinicellulosiphila megalodicopiae]|uniref:prolipoprotein diacylglyceryl transferase family protein n=1 Tax=Marinicellulosiphila megalodicopiae TaxID=2724896 RepID=UPI003BAE561E